ncbi:MAG: outer membrane lipoprotein-sorting protein [Gammaproteobacteria bacterium]
MHLVPAGLAASVIGTLVVGPASAYDTSRIEDPQVHARAARALPAHTAHPVQRVEIIGRNGGVREALRELYWKRTEDNDSRVMVRIVEPVDERGVAVLVNGDADRKQTSCMSHSPKLKQVRPVTGESCFGNILASDFTYEDFSNFHRVDEREQVTRRDEAVLDDHAVYVPEADQPGDNAHYRRVRSYIDQAFCLPMLTEFFAHNGDLRKELLAARDSVKQHGARWVPYGVPMIVHERGTRSIFEAESVAIDPGRHDAMFEMQASKTGNS